MLFNVLVGPALRCFIFLCVSVQVYGGFMTLQHYTPSATNSSYKIIHTASIYFREIIECFVSFALLTSLIEKSNGFLGRPIKESFFLYYDIGFTSAWTGLGFFFIICSNISDATTIKVLLDQFCINKDSCYMDIVYKIPSYASFCFGIICMLVGVLRIMFGKNRRPDPDSTLPSPNPYKKWTEITPTSTKYFLLFYFLVLISSTLFVALFQCIIAYHDFQGSQDIISDTNNIRLAANRAFTILILNVSHIIVAGFVFMRLVKMFWYKPFKPIAYLTALLYLYSIISFFSQLEKLEDALAYLELGWDVHNLSVYLSMFYALFPIPYWGLFVSADFGRHDEQATEQTVSILTLVFRLLRRLLYPIKDVLSEKRHWNTFLNTIAILLAITGGFSTMLSTRYEKINISFQAKGTLQSISKDFEEIHNSITNVANGFIIVAANLNPCLDYSKQSPSSGKSINNLLKEHITAKGRDGHTATVLEGDNSLMRTLYEKGSEEFQQSCFDQTGDELSWSTNTSNLCKNVKHVQDNNDFTMSKLHSKEHNSGYHPDCRNADTCLKSSNEIIPQEYKLSMNRECEATACDLFIAGVIGAFATSFVPFVGPGIAKGIQYSLKTYKLVKQFGKVFKRVATQVKEKRKKIQGLHSIFKKILGAKTLVFNNNYQFYYFLIPTILLFLIAVGLGFYRRKRPNKLSKRLFVLFFLLLGVICGIMTYLSWVFTGLLRTMLEPFNQVLEVVVEESTGMKMIKWGYLMATLSCVFFIISALMSTVGQAEQEKPETKTDSKKKPVKPTTLVPSTKPKSSTSTATTTTATSATNTTTTLSSPAITTPIMSPMEVADTESVLKQPEMSDIDESFPTTKDTEDTTPSTNEDANEDANNDADDDANDGVNGGTNGDVNEHSNGDVNDSVNNDVDDDANDGANDDASDSEVIEYSPATPANLSLRKRKTTKKKKQTLKPGTKKKGDSRVRDVSVEDRFSSWLMAFSITIPVYYIIYTSITKGEKLVNLKITPSPALEKVRVTFAHTSALERYGKKKRGF